MKIKEQNELKRLLYVAVTRAKNRLYLLGNAEAKKDGSACAKAGSNTFLGLLWPAVEHEFNHVLRRKPGVQQSLFDVAGPPVNTLRRLPANWRAPKLEHSVLWQPELYRSAASARTIRYEWVSDTGRHVGTVVHAIFRRMARDGAEAWTRERVTGMQPFISSELLRLGVPRSEERKAAAQVIRALDNTLASERGRWILAPHAEARSEWAIGGRIGDRLVNGIIDRVFRDEQNRVWVIDFKTSEHEGGEAEEFLAKEEARYRPQLESYATLLSRMMPGELHLGLYFPLLNAWREWSFVEEFAAPAV